MEILVKCHRGKPPLTSKTLLMKQVFASPDSARVGLAQSLLDPADIRELRNDAISQAMPGMPFMTELWVLRDEEYDEARPDYKIIGHQVNSTALSTE